MSTEKDIVECEVLHFLDEFNIKLTKLSEEKTREVIEDTFYCFVDISKYSNISLNCIYDKLDEKFQNHLFKSISFGELSWEDFLSYIYKFAPKKDNSVYLCISGTTGDDYSVIYEGEISDVVKLLFEGVPLGNNGDFTIMSKHYDWLIYYNDSKETLCYTSENEF